MFLPMQQVIIQHGIVLFLVECLIIKLEEVVLKRIFGETLGFCFNLVEAPILEYYFFIY